MTLEAGNTTQISATVVPADATKKTLVYTSQDSNIASVNEQGLITGVDGGTTTITVGVQNTSLTIEITVTVSVTPTGITVPEELAMTVGETEQIAYTITPSNATDTSVTCTSSDESVVTVTYDGLLTAVGAGTATITVYPNASFGVSGTIEVTVTE